MLLRNKRVGIYIHIHVLVCQEFNPLMMKYQNVKWVFFYKYRDTLFLVIITGKCMVSSLSHSLKIQMYWCITRALYVTGDVIDKIIIH